MLDLEITEQAFNRFAKAVVKQAKSNLTRGGHRVDDKLYKSLDDWQVKVSKRGSVTLVFSMEEYGEYQDRGVKGSKTGRAPNQKEPTPFKFTTKAPPFKGLRDWVAKRRFQFRDRESGKFKSYDQTARLIQQSIFKKGIPQTLFFTKPFKRQFSNLPPDIIEAFGNDVERFLTATFRDKARFR